MIAKVASGIGALLLIGAAVALVMASACSTTNPYALNVSPDGAGHHQIDGKPASGYFELSFAGSINWDLTNTTADSVTVKIRDFGPGHTGGCPVNFTFGGDGPMACSATQTIPAGQIRTISAEPGDSDPDITTKYPFKFYVNEWPADPDIEIERDPYGIRIWLIAAAGILLLVGGWWFGMRRGSAR